MLYSTVVSQCFTVQSFYSALQYSSFTVLYSTVVLQCFTARTISPCAWPLYSVFPRKQIGKRLRYELQITGDLKTKLEQTPMIVFFFIFVYRKLLEATNKLQKESEMVCSIVFLLSVKLIKYFFKTFGTGHKKNVL